VAPATVSALFFRKVLRDVDIVLID
jgi:hypothetical protein